MFKTVFIYEWMLFRRNKIQQLLLILFIGLGVYSLYLGKEAASDRLRSIQYAQSRYEKEIQQLDSLLSVDTTESDGLKSFQSASDPSYLNYRVHPLAIKHFNKLSIMAVGNSSTVPFLQPINTQTVHTIYLPQEINNSELAQWGELDLSFLLVYMFPLFLLIFCHDAISADLERGLLALIARYKWSALLLYRIGFRAGILWLIAIMLSLAGMALPCHISPDSGTAEVIWLLALTLYTVFWALICLLICSFIQNSNWNLLFLLALWLLQVIVLPGLLSVYVNSRFPDSIHYDLLSEKRDLEETIWAIPPEKLLSSFYRRHPEYQSGKEPDSLPYTNRRFAAYYEQLDNQMATLVDEINNTPLQRHALGQRWLAYNPSTAIQRIFLALGNNDREAYFQFRKEVMLFQHDWQRRYYDLVFHDRQVDQRFIREIPCFRGSTPDSWTLTGTQLLHLFWTDILLSLTLILVIRYNFLIVYHSFY